MNNKALLILFSSIWITLYAHSNDYLVEDFIISVQIESDDLKINKSTLQLTETDTLLVYQNPVKEYVYLAEHTESLIIRGSKGEVIGEGLAGDRIDVINLPAGIYILYYLDANGIPKSLQFIKSAD